MPDFGPVVEPPVSCATSRLVTRSGLLTGEVLRIADAHFLTSVVLDLVAFKANSLPVWAQVGVLPFAGTALSSASPARRSPPRHLRHKAGKK